MKHPTLRFNSPSGTNCRGPHPEKYGGVMGEK